MWTFIILVCTAVVLVVVISIMQETKNKQRVLDFLNELNNFKASQYLTDKNFTCGIALDETKEEICLWTYGINFAERRLKYKDILSVEVIQNDISIMTTNRTSQIGGALVGGVLLGGIGAVVGALSGKKETTDSKVRNLSLVLTINDIKNPIFKVVVLDAELSTDGWVYKAHKQSIDHWHGVFDVIIKQVDSELKQPAINIQDTNIDKFIELSKMLDKGLITEEEFMNFKNSIS